MCEEEETDRVSLQGIDDGLDSFVADLIAPEIECVECLCEKASMVSEGEMVSETDRVSVQGIDDGLGSFVTDLIASEIECGECL